MSEPLKKIAVSHDGYTFPADEILTGRGFITGKSGSGKSNTATVIVEELLDRDLGLLIVDTDGEYHGLKEEYDVVHVGKGDECDMTVSPSDADQFARDALNNRLAVLLDVSTYHDEEKTADVIFEVVNALFIAEHDLRVPFLLLLEEAHEFIPQQGSGSDSDLESLLIRVAKRGRKRGLGICSMSQRPASVDKDYITQCDWFIWHRLTWENDTEVVGRILGSESADTVQTLDDGEAIVMTDWDESIQRVQFRRQRTPDAGATPSLTDMDFATDRKDSNDVTEENTIGDVVKTPFGVSNGSESSTEDATRATESTEDTQPDEPAEASASTAGDGASSASESEDETPPWRYRTESIDSNQSTRERSSHSTLYSFSRAKPSLSKRREKRDTPTKTNEPIWEIGAMMVYLYDSFIWYHLYLLYRMELAVATAASRIDGLFGTDSPRQPGTLQRLIYRFLAYLSLGVVYAALVIGVLMIR